MSDPIRTILEKQFDGATIALNESLLKIKNLEQQIAEAEDIIDYILCNPLLDNEDFLHDLFKKYKEKYKDDKND